MSAPLFMAGAELGSTAEFPTSAGTVTADSTAGNHTAQGAFAYKFSSAAGNSSLTTKTGLAASTLFIRVWVKLTAAFSVNTLGALILSTAVGGSVPGEIDAVYTQSTNSWALRLLINSEGTQVGSDFPVDGNFHLVELRITPSPTVGVAEMRVDGIVQATGTGLNTGTATAIDSCTFGLTNLPGTNSTSGFTWIDDICGRSDQYPGTGYIIARQPNGTTPGDNAWTKSTGTTIDTCWNSTPFNTTSSANTATSGNKQTGVMDFTLTGGTGSTGFGTGSIDANASINGAKISWYGKTSSTATDGADSSVFRTGGVDTLTATTVYTTSDVLHEVIQATTPTTAQVRSCEAGLSKGTGTKTHTAEDLWLMVDYVPFPYSPTPKMMRKYRRSMVATNQRHFKETRLQQLVRSIQPPAASLGIKPEKHRAKIYPTQRVKLVHRVITKFSSIVISVASGVPPRMLRRRSRIKPVIQSRSLPRSDRLARLAQAPGAFKPKHHTVRAKLTTTIQKPHRGLLKRLIQPPASALGVKPAQIKRKPARNYPIKKVRIGHGPISRLRSLIQPPSASLGFKPSKHRVKLPRTQKTLPKGRINDRIQRIAEAPFGVLPRLIRRHTKIKPVLRKTPIAKVRAPLHRQWLYTPRAQIAQALTASIATSATLLKQIGKNIVATVAVTATIVNSIGKSISASIAVSGTITRSIGKLINSSISLSASITKSINTSLSSSIALSSTLIKSIGKLLSATLSLIASIAYTITHVQTISAAINLSATVSRQIAKSLTSAIALVATLTRQIAKEIDSSIALSATIIRSIGKTISTTIALSATLVKSALKTLSASIASSATLIANAIYARTLSTSIVLSATLTKSISTTLSTTIAVSSTVIKSINKALSATASLIATVAANFAFLVTLSATIATNATISRVINKLLSVSISLTLSISKLISTTITTSISLTGSINKSITQTINASIALSASFIKSVSSTIEASIVAASTITRSVAYNILLSTVIATSATITRSIVKTLSAIIGVSASFVKLISKFIDVAMGALGLVDHTSTSGFAQSISSIVTTVASLVAKLLHIQHKVVVFPAIIQNPVSIRANTASMIIPNAEMSAIVTLLAIMQYDRLTIEVDQPIVLKGNL